MHELNAVAAQAINDRLVRLVGEERRVQAEFLVALAELDERRLYAELGYASLWDYCIRGRRWRAARNYFNGYLAAHEGHHHNAGRGWTKQAALRHVNRICGATAYPT